MRARQVVPRVVRGSGNEAVSWYFVAAHLRNSHRGLSSQAQVQEAENREFLDKLGRELGVRELWDWYSISEQDVRKNGGVGLLHTYEGLEGALRALFPQFDWQSSRFATNAGTVIRRGYWDSLDNQRQQLDWIGRQLGVKQLEDWYGVCRNDVVAWGGGRLFAHYPSLEAALKTLYKDFPWQRSRFGEAGRMVRDHFGDVNNQRILLEKISKDIGIKELSEWYSVSRKEFVRHGGWRLLKLHSSMEGVLKALHPNYPWVTSNFTAVNTASRVESGYWQKKENVVQALGDAEKKLGIVKPEDWYSVRLSDLRALGLPDSLKKTQLAVLLCEKYPTNSWHQLFTLKGKYSQQKRLERAVTTLFPGVEMKANVRKEAGLINPSNREYMELDIFLPSLRLAFEYHERHHYISSSATFVPLEQNVASDKIKQELARSKGIDLLVIPCWWDGTQESLVATIRRARPDLLHEFLAHAASQTPIPDTAPPGFFDSQYDSIEDIGQPVLASFFTRSSVDPTNWWMFEKYDGVRGFWNPLKRSFYSRTGKRIELPQAIIEALPRDLFLDGELWYGRENFQEAMKLVHKTAESNIDWARFKYMVFDIPTHSGTYEERYNLLENQMRGNPSKYVEIAQRVLCKDALHLEEFFQDVMDKGGEGIILRNPSAPFQPGRSPGFLKHKKYRDGEARIVGTAGPQLWECELPTGARFIAPAGSSEFSKRWTPNKGDIVSFKHQGFLLASKKPKFPTLHRLRPDMGWQDVVQNWRERKSTPSALPLRRKKPNRPKGYWADVENVSKFFTELAKDMGFDPLRAEEWNKVQIKDLQEKKGHGLLAHYNYSLREALKAAFPTLRLRLKAPRVKKRHWEDAGNCRAFFDDFAKEKGFDPMDIRAWYDADFRDLEQKQGGYRLIRAQGGWKRALQAAYPEIDFRWTHAPPKESKWKDAHVCRDHFVHWAMEKGFDPLSLEGWYSVNLRDLSATKEGMYISEEHGGLKKALQLAFPEVLFKWTKGRSAEWNDR